MAARKISALILGVLLPGAGHALLGRPLLGVILAGTYGALLLTVASGGIAPAAEWEFAVALPLLWGLAVADIYRQVRPPAASLAVHYRDGDAAARIGAYLARQPLPAGPIKIFCPGCGRLAGDSFGPRVGDLLAAWGHDVCGTSGEYLNAVTLPDRLQAIGPGDYVIVVDAVIGSKPEQEGIISIKPGPVRPGSALGKRLPVVGHLAVLFTASVFRPGNPLAGFDEAAAGARSAEAAAIVAAALHNRLSL